MLLFIFLFFYLSVGLVVDTDRSCSKHNGCCTNTVFVEALQLQPLSALNPRKMLIEPAVKGYQERVAADPSFPTKSAIEVFLAATTQLSAEWNRRGAAQMLPQIDFVVAGLLTAVAGKFYSMWRVAPTLSANNTANDEADVDSDADRSKKEKGVEIPTNAFQATLLDGVTKPTLSQRCLSFLIPMPSLFQAGVVASAIGYGSVALLIRLRTLWIPSYTATTQSVNVLLASVYTGIFMALVSNIRYQLLQGVIEPKLVDPLRNNKTAPWLHSVLTTMIRLGNGFLGSTLAIMGMKAMGLQKLKD